MKMREMGNIMTKRNYGNIVIYSFPYFIIKIKIFIYPNNIYEMLILLNFLN